MEQRDYLMRQVEQAGLVLRKILSKLLGLKDNDTEAVSVINQQFAEELGLDLLQLIEAKDDQWIDTLKNRADFDSGNLEKLADLLSLMAEKNLTRESDQFYKKSLAIYKYLETSEKTYSFERNFKIAKIESSIDF